MIDARLERREAQVEQDHGRDIDLMASIRAAQAAQRAKADPSQVARIGPNGNIVPAPADIAEENDRLERERKRFADAQAQADADAQAMQALEDKRRAEWEAQEAKRRRRGYRG